MPLAILSASSGWCSLATSTGTLEQSPHESLRMQVTLWSCQEGGCSSAPLLCWDSFHLCLPSLPFIRENFVSRINVHVP